MAKMTIKKSTTKSKKKEVDEKDLLAVAKGTKSPTLLRNWVSTPPPGQDFFRYRREARRAIYAIIKHWKFGWDFSDDEKLMEMHNIIDTQLDPNRQIQWTDFTHKWDLHPKDVTKIVFKEHWVKEGGGFDVESGLPYPTAFTEQGHD